MIRLPVLLAGLFFLLALGSAAAARPHPRPDEARALRQANGFAARSGTTLTLRTSVGRKTFRDNTLGAKEVYSLISYSNGVFVVRAKFPFGEHTDDDYWIIDRSGSTVETSNPPHLSPSARYFVELAGGEGTDEDESAKTPTVNIWRQTKNGFMKDAKDWDESAYAANTQRYEFGSWDSEDQVTLTAVGSDGEESYFSLRRVSGKWKVTDEIFEWSYDDRELTGAREIYEGDTDIRLTCLRVGVAEVNVGAEDHIGEGNGERVTLRLRSASAAITLNGRSRFSPNSELTGGTELRANVGANSGLIKMLTAPGAIVVTGSNVKMTLPEPGRLEAISRFRKGCFPRKTGRRRR
jgi:hypothetical protein